MANIKDPNIGKSSTFLFFLISLQLISLNSQSTFAQFKAEMQTNVRSISTQMDAVYANRCNSTLLNCEKKSYNYCQGTATKQKCIDNFPTPGGCVGKGASLAFTSAVRFPNTTDASALSTEQRHFVCTSAQLEPVFLNLSSNNNGRYTFTYFGTQLGSFRNFPSNPQQKDENGNCKNYDPRFRPWYVTGSSSGKNLILILDISGSMSNNNRMATAINAAKAVINTLSNQDFVGVIKFSSLASALVSNQTKRATTAYKDELIAAIEALTPQGATNYEAAFNLGFNMLSSAASDQFGSPCANAENIFLFVTDGSPTIGALTQAALQTAINARNSAFDITMFTYGMDTDVAGVDTTILKGLACAYHGIYFQIPSTASSSQLLTLMRSYYEYIANGVTITQPQWTQPYIDAFGFGNIVTVSFPAYYTENGVRKILGVAGIDVSVDYVTKTYSINQTQMQKQLLNNAVCYTSSLTACQIQFLRPANAKCGTAGCTAPNTQNTCSSITTDIYKPTASKDTSLCCGLSVGGLVGLIIGLLVAIILIVIIVFCIVKQAKRRLAQEAQIQDANLAQGNNKVVIQHRYAQPAVPGYFNNSIDGMGSGPQWNNNAPQY